MWKKGTNKCIGRRFPRVADARCVKPHLSPEEKAARRSSWSLQFLRKDLEFAHCSIFSILLKITGGNLHLWIKPPNFMSSLCWLVMRKRWVFPFHNCNIAAGAKAVDRYCSGFAFMPWSLSSTTEYHGRKPAESSNVFLGQSKMTAVETTGALLKRDECYI